MVGESVQSQMVHIVSQWTVKWRRVTEQSQKESGRDTTKKLRCVSFDSKGTVINDTQSVNDTAIHLAEESFKERRKRELEPKDHQRV